MKKKRASENRALKENNPWADLPTWDEINVL